MQMPMALTRSRKPSNFCGTRGKVVQTRVFAPPGRSQNKKWAKFFKVPGVSFRPASGPKSWASWCFKACIYVIPASRLVPRQVVRSINEKVEPNDNALHRAVKKAGRSDVERLALLTSDTGFVDSLGKAQAKGTSVIAFVPRPLSAESEYDS